MTQCPYGFFHYTVKPGETYQSLAEKFCVGAQAIKDLNGFPELRGGMKIRVPCACGCARGSFYTLIKGDTLTAVARKNGLGLSELLAANPYLNPSHYIAGQVIVIPPVPPRPAAAQYTLGEDEGLFDVLRKFRMDLTTFCMLNPDISPLTLKGGQRVGIRPPRVYGGRWDIVRAGEDLVKTAARHGIKVSALLGANENLRPGDFVPGRKIRIPGR